MFALFNLIWVKASRSPLPDTTNIVGVIVNRVVVRVAVIQVHVVRVRAIVQRR